MLSPNDSKSHGDSHISAPPTSSSRSPQTITDAVEENTPPLSDSPRAPQLTTGYTPPPNFSAPAPDHRSPHGQQLSSYPQQYAPYQYDPSSLQSHGVPLPAPPPPGYSSNMDHGHNPYPIPVDAPIFNLASAAMNCSNSSAQPQPLTSNTVPKQPNPAYQHYDVKTHGMTPEYVTHVPVKSKRRCRKFMWMFLFACVVIGVGAGVGYHLSNKKSHDKNISGTTNNGNPPGSNPTNVPSSGTTSPSSSVGPIPSTTTPSEPTGTQRAEPVIDATPLPSTLPPAGKCPNFYCTDYDTKCRDKCEPDGEYRKCFDGCLDFAFVD
ncbi:hypothetical protein BX616_010322 [Lobosporangium transversale]|uniref:Uncharacterized protein n=1 Tax=Lobosporangium transversale TaxID=64571 RepID=A0A1Y2GCB8_9FUNG|nr:hypothetical protein BCR41DRAFT_424899 [Lobosporangium transversale]KAF9912433.1 hypothetical protein BX616_010322 [Lobosporangium transversale]ORZ06961.1 hypothetical protein BCR41DRAFT_424899 [Lobosporangium transversale]|eukprot:XP_021877757.1 hypothetical protein BCR41DRAFT_424899 [Lobosporangium transversale]